MNTTPGVQQQHTIQTDTPKSRYIAPGSTADRVVYAVTTDPEISRQLKENTTKQAGYLLLRAVLTSLAVHVDDKGVSKVSQQRIANDLLLDRRDVQNALAVLEQIPALLHPVDATVQRGKVKRYLVLPDLLTKLQQGAEVDGKVDGKVDGQVDGISRHKGKEKDIYPPAEKSKTATRQGGQGENGSLVESCVKQDLLQFPPSSPAGRGLKKELRDTYSAIVATAIGQYPNATATAIVALSIHTRRQLPLTKELLKELDPDRYNCPTCKGALVVPGQAYRDERDNWVNPGNTPCPECRPQNVTQIDTRKRVNTSTNTYTDIPGGTPTADTLLPVADLARHFIR